MCLTTPAFGIGFKGEYLVAFSFEYEGFFGNDQGVLSGFRDNINRGKHSRAQQGCICSGYFNGYFNRAAFGIYYRADHFDCARKVFFRCGFNRNARGLPYGDFAKVLFGYLDACKQGIEFSYGGDHLIVGDHVADLNISQRHNACNG